MRWPSRGREAAPPALPVPRPIPVASMPPGAMTFRTEAARRRFIPLAIQADALEVTATDHRLGRRRSTALSLTALPETISCGGGYLEVLYAMDGGFVVDEIRTFGDEVVVVPITIGG